MGQSRLFIELHTQTRCATTEEIATFEPHIGPDDIGHDVGSPNQFLDSEERGRKVKVETCRSGDWS